MIYNNKNWSFSIALYGMPGIMESVLHVLSFFLNFSYMISSLILLGNEFQRFGP